MHFIIYAKDKPDALAIRTANRDAHLAFLNAKASVTVCVAGPLLSDDKQMIGSLLIVEAEDQNLVQEWLKNDPYGRAGLSESITVHPYIWAIGKP